LWNPVKELKGLRAAAWPHLRLLSWNPVKELKGTERHAIFLAMNEWNPVKELKVIGLYADHAAVRNVESGEGIERLSASSPDGVLP